MPSVRDSAAKNWCYTLHENVENSRLGRCLPALHALHEHVAVRCHGYQLERCPDTGRVHVQGFLCLHPRMRLRQVKRLLPDPTVHLEKMGGQPADSIEYCSKDDSRLSAEDGAYLAAQGWEHGSGPFLFGDQPLRQGQRTDLEALAEAIKNGATDLDLADTMPAVFVKHFKGARELRLTLQSRVAKQPRDVEVIVYTGPTGAGKSHKAYTENPNAFTLMAPRSEKGGCWWDGYMGESTVIIDEFRGDWMPYATLLRILDKWPYRPETKGGSTWALYTKVIITSTHHPDTWYAAENNRGELARRITRIERLEPRVADPEPEVTPVTMVPGPEVAGNTIRNLGATPPATHWAGGARLPGLPPLQPEVAEELQAARRTYGGFGPWADTFEPMDEDNIPTQGFGMDWF